ncbi:hypothetical protein [Streptomyces adustus]|nr:hypothetical protein [Streptomyces adustus]
MKRHGLGDETTVCRTACSDEGGYKAGMSLLTGEDRPTAALGLSC